MIWLVIVILILLFILLLPASATIEFEDNLKLTIRVLFFKFNIPLADGKKEKADKKSDIRESAQGSAKEKKGEKESTISKLNYVRKIVSAVSRRIPNMLTVTKLGLHVTVGNDDPCDAALAFGAISAAAYPLVSLIDSYLKVKKKDVYISVDYKKTSIHARFELTVRTFLLKLIICAIIILIDIAKEK